MDEQIGDTVPCEDAVRNDDALDTQVNEFGDETQLVDSDDETQIMDFAGETQVMDGYDCIEHMDTQLLVVSDSETECKSDGEGAGQTQVLDDTVGLNDIHYSDRNCIQATADKGKGSHCHQDDAGVETDSLPSDARSSGSLRRGFASVRTASLRAAGLAARKMSLKEADSAFCSTVIGGGSFKLHSSNDDVSVGQAVELKYDIAEHDEKGLSYGETSNAARSLARELFMEEDVAEEGSEENLNGRKAGCSLLSGCDNELAGLSYVDSQEPGELSQANALEFVDRFLKVNVLESDENVIRRNAVSEMVTPAAITKGTNNVAQQANQRSTLIGKTIFDWDDKLEDEGGGEFFTKTKEVLFGTSCRAQNSCRKPRSSRHVEPRGSLSFRKIRNAEEQQNGHDTLVGLFNSDSKLKADKIGLDSCGGQALAAAGNDESAYLLNVGIDTQMAAEAMEALSTGTPLVTTDSSLSDHGPKNGSDGGKRETTKNVYSKLNSVQKRACLASSGVITRSRSTKETIMKSGGEFRCSPRARTRSQHVTEKFKVDLVKPKGKRSRLSANNTSAVHKSELSDIGRGNLEGMKSESILGGLVNNQPLPVVRHSLRAEVSTLHKTRQHEAVNKSNGSCDATDDSSVRRHCLDAVHNRKRRTRSDMASGNPNARLESLDLTIVADTAMVDGSSDRGRDLQDNLNQDNGSGQEGNTSRPYGGREVAFGSVARQTRSKKRAQCAEGGHNAKRLHFSSVLSLKKSCQLLPEKQDARSHPAKGALVAAKPEGSPKVKQKSSCTADTTPDHLKMPESAVSPICMGDKYHTPSCKKNLSLTKEFYRLSECGDKCTSPFRVLRRRRDMNSVRVLFSQHLDEDIIRQQKKILSRLSISEAPTISEATHFVADTFVRTRNMLDAIANAKLVVTHLWLESCGQASCLIDEKKYILRDTKKEKELGFTMPLSLALASSRPLLEGRRVLITPNIKPGKEVILSLVKAVHGQTIERWCRSMSNNNKLLDDLLVLSCEEDFEVCVPLLEKGIAVHSSELLLNGIITQRLEYDRYCLFVAHIKKTRSTLWLKKDGDRFLPVAKTK